MFTAAIAGAIEDHWPGTLSGLVVTTAAAPRVDCHPFWRSPAIWTVAATACKARYASLRRASAEPKISRWCRG